MIPDGHREFLESHRLCVVGFARKSGPPSLTPVYYYLDSDEMVISTTAGRAKAKAVRRNPEISLCVLDENPPFLYLTVFGRGRIEEVGAAETMMKVGEKMTGAPVAESARPGLEARAKNEGRVVLRVTPVGFASTQAMGRRA